MRPLAKTFAASKQSVIYSVLLFICSFVVCTFSATPDSTTSAPPVKEKGYRIEQPGTITFTVGVKISGKVEKPQVMIFLPKEKTVYREEVLQRSFKNELTAPLPFIPVLE